MHLDKMSPNILGEGVGVNRIFSSSPYHVKVSPEFLDIHVYLYDQYLSSI